ncbi:hypothetical protein CC80DRAFT_139628 [Byssothecium circinans]|uniref:Uncharacterized protein n=1 Tax=Byssothecium circinans TaxID=147558 RepID=A0A6A5TMQ4_9PLEO|nr:hypothetical protein CC80DRAFT_139628 [Byssothecium circinans]
MVSASDPHRLGTFSMCFVACTDGNEEYCCQVPRFRTARGKLWWGCRCRLHCALKTERRRLQVNPSFYQIFARPGRGFSFTSLLMSQIVSIARYQMSKKKNVPFHLIHQSHPRVPRSPTRFRQSPLSQSPIPHRSITTPRAQNQQVLRNKL